jgi:hypothetical protein
MAEGIRGVRFGMVEAMENELIKETLGIKVSPHFAMIKGNQVIEYNGSRNKELIKQFIEKDHQ